MQRSALLYFPDVIDLCGVDPTTPAPCRWAHPLQQPCSLDPICMAQPSSFQRGRSASCASSSSTLPTFRLLSASDIPVGSEVSPSACSCSAASRCTSPKLGYDQQLSSPRSPTQDIAVHIAIDEHSRASNMLQQSLHARPVLRCVALDQADRRAKPGRSAGSRPRRTARRATGREHAPSQRKTRMAEAGRLRGLRSTHAPAATPVSDPDMAFTLAAWKIKP